MKGRPKARTGPDASNNAMTAAAACRSLSGVLGAFVEILDTPRSGASGPLDGMPIAIKDMIDIAGRAPTFGFARAPRRIPQQNARIFDILSQAGATTVAFTQMTPLAYEPSGANMQFGRPKNPWSDRHICGGSSSGSAVAVAAGCVPLALGSDTAGSLRIPAHCCGITAWKPSFGLVPLDGAMPLAPSLDTIGFLARSAGTIAPVADLFATSEVARSIRHVAVAHDLGNRSAEAIRSALAMMERTLEAIGCLLKAVALEAVIGATDPPVLVVLQAEAARSNADLMLSGVLDRGLQSRLDRGVAITDGQLEEARSTLRALARTETERIFSNCDALVLPVMPLSTPPVAVCEPSSPTFSARTLYALSSFTRFVNALGLPAVALPCGLDEAGLPIGMQLIGRHGCDRSLIALACEIQESSDWHCRLPPVRVD